MRLRSTNVTPSYHRKTETNPDAIIHKIRIADKFFKRACSQITLLNNKICTVKTRYERDRFSNRLSFRCLNRMKIFTLEGVCDLIYEYACTKRDQIETFQARLIELVGENYYFSSVDDDDGDDDDDDDDDNDNSGGGGVGIGDGDH